MLGALRPDALLVFKHRSRRGEVPVDLPVEVFSVGDDYERPVAGKLPQHLLREEDHRIALARTLRVPEDAELALILLDFLHGADGAVHAEELVVLGDQLGGLALASLKIVKFSTKSSSRASRRRPGSSCPG